MKPTRSPQRPTKLPLRRETVRQLIDGDLARIAGGYFTSDDCPTTTSTKLSGCDCQTF